MVIINLRLKTYKKLPKGGFLFVVYSATVSYTHLDVYKRQPMELRVLRYFLTVAKEQSFTKAAEQLHITQPTLSRQLAALEEELGTALFNRGGRCITLTAAGLLLKRRCV